MRQESGVEHVRIGHHDMPALADRGPAARRSVAVVRVGAQLDRQAVFQRAQLRQLVLRQRFGRKQVKGPLFRVFEQPLKDR